MVDPYAALQRALKRLEDVAYAPSREPESLLGLMQENVRLAQEAKRDRSPGEPEIRRYCEDCGSGRVTTRGEVFVCDQCRSEAVGQVDWTADWNLPLMKDLKPGDEVLWQGQVQTVLENKTMPAGGGFGPRNHATLQRSLDGSQAVESFSPYFRLGVPGHPKSKYTH